MKKIIISFLLVSCLFLSACSVSDIYDGISQIVEIADMLEELNDYSEGSISYGDHLIVSEIPEFAGKPSVIINDNRPFFTEDEIKSAAKPIEQYSELDSLGRCGVAIASVCPQLMPTGERGSISRIHPSGWTSGDAPASWNRCHLIGWQLAGENDNEKNLITGTRYMNVDGMLPYENEIDDFVEETGMHVLYRVTPIFTGDNLIADGVLMEAYSVEDNGGGVCFNVYCYNVAPGVVIDYATGKSWIDLG